MTYAENKAELMGAKLVQCADTRLWYAHLGEPKDFYKQNSGTGTTPEMALSDLELILIRESIENWKKEVDKILDKLFNEQVGTSRGT